MTEETGIAGAMGADEAIQAKKPAGHCFVCGKPIKGGYSAKVLPPLVETCSATCHDTEAWQQAAGRELEAARATLTALGYTYEGGTRWRPPRGPAPDFSTAATMARIEAMRARTERHPSVIAFRAMQAAQAMGGDEESPLDQAIRMLTDERRAAEDREAQRRRDAWAAS